MKHINKFCTSCNTNKSVEDYYNNKHQEDKLDTVCKTCRKNYNNKTNPKSNPKSNPHRMFVNGKYIPKSHPLHKPGNFKTFEDAAFQSLSRYSTSKEGQVYIITNPAWKGWIKVGMAVDANDRCNGYQTSSPMRDYKLQYSKDFKDRRSAESEAHKLCAKKSKDRNGEWFKLDIKTAISCIENIILEKNNA